MEIYTEVSWLLIVYIELKRQKNSRIGTLVAPVQIRHTYILRTFKYIWDI